MFEMEGKDDCAAVPASTTLSLFTAAVSGVVALVTVPCNILVCLVILRSPPRLKNLRTPFTYFILNLALTDLLVGAATEPISVVYHLIEARSVSSPSLVRLLQVLYFLTCTVSVLSILALTLERFYAISKPFKYRQSVTNSRVFLASGMIWILSSGFITPYFVMGYRVFSLVFANVVILITLCTVIYAYFKIIKTIQRRKNIRQDSLQGLFIANRQVTLYEEKLTRTFTSILILFAICYVTPCLLIYTMNLCTKCSCDTIHWLRDSTFLAVTCNSAINPFLYAWRLPSFRHALRIMMPGCTCHMTLDRDTTQGVVYSLKKPSNCTIVFEIAEIEKRNLRAPKPRLSTSPL